MFFANLILLLLFNKSPDDKDVVAATVVAIIIRADSMMARSGIADNKFNAPFFHYQAPPSVTIRSVMNPAHNPTKMPIIRMLFVACLLAARDVVVDVHLCLRHYYLRPYVLKMIVVAV